MAKSKTTTGTSTKASTKTIRVAAAQLPGLPLDRASESLAHIDRAIAQAADQSVQLLVLPECAYPAYYLGATDAYPNTDTLDPDAFVDHLRTLAKEHAMHVACGFVDQRDDRLYNAAIIIDAEGNECGRSDKSFLWGDDNIWFTPGDTIEPIDTPLGRIGAVICADGRAPEIATGLVAQGAQLLIVPTCWVNVAKASGQYANAQAEFMIRARAIECGVPIVAANKFGRETPDLSYCGWSAIHDANGDLIAQAPPDEAALIVANLKLSKPPAIESPRWAVRRIFGHDPPVPPDEDPAHGAVGIAVCPRCLTADLIADEHDGLRALADRGIAILASCASDEETAARFEIYGRALGMTVVNYPYVERLMIERFGAFGCISGEHASSFFPARVMALDGASIVFIVGGDADLSVLRTRAAENRVFVAAVFESSAALINPAGAVMERCSADDPRILFSRIDLNQAVSKEVFDRTHIWDQRNPTAYAKAFGVGQLLHEFE